MFFRTGKSLTYLHFNSSLTHSTNHKCKSKTDLFILYCHRCLTRLHGFTIMLKLVSKIYNSKSQPAARIHHSNVWFQLPGSAHKHLNDFKMNYLHSQTRVAFFTAKFFTAQCHRQRETMRKGATICGEKKWLFTYTTDTFVFRHSRGLAAGMLWPP